MLYNYLSLNQVHNHVLPIFREALKKAYDELPKSGCAIDVGTFLEFMLEYKPLMRELHNEWLALFPGLLPDFISQPWRKNFLHSYKNNTFTPD